MRIQTKPNWYILTWVKCKPNTKATEILLNSLHGKMTENVSSTLVLTPNAYRNEGIYSVSSPIIVSCMLHTHTHTVQCAHCSYHLSSQCKTQIQKLYNLQALLMLLYCCSHHQIEIKFNENGNATMLKGRT